MGLGYPPLTPSRQKPLGGAVEGSRSSASAPRPEPGTTVAGRRRAGAGGRLRAGWGAA